MNPFFFLSPYWIWYNIASAFSPNVLWFGPWFWFKILDQGSNMQPLQWKVKSQPLDFQGCLWILIFKGSPHNHFFLSSTPASVLVDLFWRTALAEWDAVGDRTRFLDNPSFGPNQLLGTWMGPMITLGLGSIKELDWTSCIWPIKSALLGSIT